MIKIRSTKDLAKSIDTYFQFEYGSVMRQIKDDVERDSMLDAAARRVLLGYIITFRRDIIGMLSDNSLEKYISEFNPSALKFDIVDLDAPTNKAALNKVSSRKRLSSTSLSSSLFEDFAMLQVERYKLLCFAAKRPTANSVVSGLTSPIDRENLITIIIHYITQRTDMASESVLKKYVGFRTVGSLCKQLLEDFGGHRP